MSFKQHLDNRSVKGISDVLVSAFDSVAEQIVKLSLMPPLPPVPVAILPVPIVPLSIAVPVVAYVVGKTMGSPADAPGLLILMTNLETDINTLLLMPLMTNAIGMNLLPTPKPPLPIPPLSPVALSLPVVDINAQNFGKACLDWAASFITGDPRAGGPIIIP